MGKRGFSRGEKRFRSWGEAMRKSEMEPLGKRTYKTMLPDMREGCAAKAAGCEWGTKLCIV